VGLLSQEIGWEERLRNDPFGVEYDVSIDVTNVCTFFYFGHVFTFLTFFLFSKRFIFKKNVGKVQSGKHINKKHFQNNNNEIDL